MNFIKKFDFNYKTGYGSVVFFSVGISLLFFSLAYLFEGFGWLTAYKEEANNLYLDIGWNWIRGSGIAFLVAVILLVTSVIFLNKNKKLSKPKAPLFGRLDINQPKGLLALVFLSTSSVFFFNGIVYRIEATKWFYAGLETATVWFLNEASAWITTSTIMFFIGILLSASGWTLIALQWIKKYPKKA